MCQKTSCKGEWKKTRNPITGEIFWSCTGCKRKTEENPSKLKE